MPSLGHKQCFIVTLDSVFVPNENRIGRESCTDHKKMYLNIFSDKKN